MRKALSIILAALVLTAAASFTASAAVYSQGDVNMDNAAIGTEDLVTLQKILLGSETETETANVNGDEDGVDIRDLICLKKIIAFGQEDIVLTEGTNEFVF